MIPASPSTLHLARLQRQINAVRRKRFLVKTMTGLFLALRILIGGLTNEAILDRLVNLPEFARAVILIGCLFGSVYWFWKECLKPLHKRLNDDEISLIIEHALPQFSTRFIASIQLAREPKTRQSSLVRALLVETTAMADSFNFKEVIKTAKLKRILKNFAAILATAAFLFFAGGEVSVVLLKRVFLFNIPLPGWTYIVTVTGDRNIGVGEDFKIEVTTGGMIPTQGQIIVSTAQGQKREFVLSRTSDKSPHFSAVIHGSQETFSYQVKLGDATSPTYQVKVLKRPTVISITCEQIYPAYIGIPPVTLQVTDLSLLVGSRLVLKVKASMPLAKALLKLEGMRHEISMSIDPKDPTLLHGELEIPAKDLTGFSVFMVSADGIESKESVVYRIERVPDRDPSVKIIAPSRREEIATAQAVLGIAFEASDDFGISKAALHYKVDLEPEKTVDFELGASTKKMILRQFDWKISSLQPPLKIGGIIEFWIVVTDCNNVSGPGIGCSDHYQIKIVGEDEKRVDLANRLRDTISGVSDITDSQQELSKKLGEPLFEKKP